MGRCKHAVVFFLAVSLLILGAASPVKAATLTTSQAYSVFESILGSSRASEIRNYRGTIMDFIEDSGNLTTSTLYDLKVATTTRFTKLQAVKGAFAPSDISATFTAKAKTRILNAVKGSMVDICNYEYGKTVDSLKKSYNKSLAAQINILNAVKASSTKQYNSSTLPLRSMRDSLDRFASFETYKQIRDSAITEGYQAYYQSLPSIIDALKASSTAASTTLSGCISTANN